MLHLRCLTGFRKHLCVLQILLQMKKTNSKNQNLTRKMFCKQFLAEKKAQFSEKQTKKLMVFFSLKDIQNITS